MLHEKLLRELQEYVEEHFNRLVIDSCEMIKYSEHYICEYVEPNELEDFIENNRKPTFHQVLFDFIDQKGVTDTSVYKRAGIDRRHFSKIRSNQDYHPRKNTVLALAFALTLNKKETDKLLSAAGYSLSESETFDLVIQFCLEKEISDIHLVNEALDYFSLKPLGGVS